MRKLVVGTFATLDGVMQEGGELQGHGSGNLIQTLLQHDLVDTLRIWQTGAVLHVNERSGGLKYGEGEGWPGPVIFDSEAAHK